MQEQQSITENTQNYEQMRKQKGKESKMKDGEHRVSQGNIDAMYEVLMGQSKVMNSKANLRASINKDEKIVAIFQHFCQHSPHNLSTISKYFQNVQLQCSNIKINQEYSKYYEQYLPSFISSNQQISQHIAQSIINQSKSQLLTKIQVLLAKQTYDTQAMETLIDAAIVAQETTIWKCAEVTVYPYDTNNSQTCLNIKSHQFLHQLLHKLLHIPIKQQQLWAKASIVLNQAWSYTLSSNYVIRFVEACLRSDTNADQDMNGNGGFKLVWELECMMNGVENSKEEKSVGWCFVQMYYLDSNEKYRKFRLTHQIESMKININTEKQIDLINKSSPNQLFLISTLNLPPLSLTTSTLSSNVRYLNYFEIQNYPKYAQQQLQIVKQTLINNSYPTGQIIVEAYLAVTNVVWEGIRLDQVNKNNNETQAKREEEGQCEYQWRQQIKQAVKAVRHQISKIIMNKQYHNNILLQGALNEQTRAGALMTNLSNNSKSIVGLELDEMDFNRDSQQILVILTILTAIDTEVSVQRLLTIMQHVKQMLKQQKGNEQEERLLVLFSFANYVGQVYHHKNINNTYDVEEGETQPKMKEVRLKNQQQTKILINVIQQIITLLLGSPQQPLNTSIKGSQKFITAIFSLSVMYTSLSKQLAINTNTDTNTTINKFFLSSSIRLNNQQKLMAYLSDNAQCKQCRLKNHKQNHYRSAWKTSAAFLDLALQMCCKNTFDQSMSMDWMKEMPYIDNTRGLIKVFKLLTQRTTKPIISQYLIQIYSQHTTPPLKNLHKFNQTAIKYSETTEHNPKYRQSVFESDMYRNHCAMYVYLNVLELYLNFVQCQQKEQEGQRQRQRREYVEDAICEFVVKRIDAVKRRMVAVLHNTAQFYSILNFFKFMAVVSYHPAILTKLTLCPSLDIIVTLFEITHSSSIHPLVRQYISLVIAKLYVNCTQRSIQIKVGQKQQERIKQVGQTWRQILISKINNQDNQVFNINATVPVVFTLGYQMIHYTAIINSHGCEGYSKQATMLMGEESEVIFSAFIRYISCHHAYIRSIVQYYIKLKIEIQTQAKTQTKGSDIKQQDSQQDQEQSFLNYLCNSVWNNDKDCIKIMKNIGIAVQGFRQAMDSRQALEFLGYQRVEECPTQTVLRQMRHDLTKILSSIYKINQKKLSINQCQQPKSDLTRINKLIQQKIVWLSTIKYSPSVYPLVLHYRRPQIIIIASLLQKVHNFGYIIRTLHSNPVYHGTMLLVPSKLPLEHPECKQFIPHNSQVEVIEVKETELQQFIKLNRRDGYPLIALEQCAGSVKVEQYTFPDQYMLLLGNQRIGAPAALLNMADVLVEIEQVGKVRSFNVHVSMVLCLWQSLIKNQTK